MLLLMSNAYSQAEFATDRGSLSLGGGINFYTSGGDLYQNADGSRNFSFNFNPDFLVFVVPSFAIGAELQFSYYGSGDYTSNTIGVGPTFMYCIAGHRDQKVYPFISESIFVDFYSYNNSASDISGDSKGLNTTTSLGVMFMLSEAVALNTRITYFSRTTLGENSISGNEIFFGIGIRSFIF